MEAVTNLCSSIQTTERCQPLPRRQAVSAPSQGIRAKPPSSVHLCLRLSPADKALREEECGLFLVKVPYISVRTAF